MYLCICNAVSEDRVIKAIESGCSSFNEISMTWSALSADNAPSGKESAKDFFCQYGEHSQSPSQFSAA